MTLDAHDLEALASSVVDSHQTTSPTEKSSVIP